MNTNDFGPWFGPRNGLNDSRCKEIIVDAYEEIYGETISFESEESLKEADLFLSDSISDKCEINEPILEFVVRQAIGHETEGKNKKINTILMNHKLNNIYQKRQRLQNNVKTFTAKDAFYVTAMMDVGMTHQF